MLVFKINAPFIGCINVVLIDNVEDLDVVKPMYNLLEYSKNYSKTTESLWNYHRDESNSGVNGSVNYSIRSSKFNKNGIEIVVSLKHLSNFQRTIVMSLINCEIELILTWF